jgi:hypothetical protein
MRVQPTTVGSAATLQAKKRKRRPLKRLDPSSKAKEAEEEEEKEEGLPKQHDWCRLPTMAAATMKPGSVRVPYMHLLFNPPPL